MSEDDEWLRSKALLALLIANGRAPSAAVSRLWTGLISGHIRAKALRAVMTKPWPAPMGHGEVADRIDVPRHYWAGTSGDSEIDLVEDLYWSNSSRTGFHTVRLTGLLFNQRDVTGFLNLAIPEAAHAPPPEPPSSGEGDLRGKLPPNAKPADRRDEEYAHAAAALVREGVKLSDALRRVAPADPTRTDLAIEKGIRRSFGLMYGPEGRAIRP